ncbi:MAG: tRNA guanosine(34) transglycosylase Tgt [Deferribacterota bacterium]|nr:tRNA guanosine(34) transglycosylase Tgt [Deferribacterota bacterium]
MSNPYFELISKDKKTNARCGQLFLNHGVVNTPIFMPVGTYGCVKTLTPSELKELGAEIILCNAYHLFLRPGVDIIKKYGSLHQFISWDRPILTDSGGFQVYSLSELRKIDEEGVSFRSHLDGSLIYLTPEKCIEIQEGLGVDIMMAFDECPYSLADKSYIESSIKLTSKWASRSINARIDKNKKLFGIVQGGIYKDLRKKSAKDIINMGFDGFAIGGLSVGEEKKNMYEIAEYTASLLPVEKPRYIMGVGTPEDLLWGISFGIDMFDCVMPTRNARNGLLFTSNGRIHVKKQKYIYSDKPIDSNCDCYTCKNFSLGYLRHLYKIKEMLAYRLNTIHNLYFYISLVKKAKNAINSGNYENFFKNSLDKILEED